jgi:transcriptional regulator GlxA family with amidase domain
VAVIGVVVFEGAEELDFVGPWEVFTAAAALAGGGDVVKLLGEACVPVRCAKGMVVVPDTAWADAPALDVLVVPGGDGRRAQMYHPPMRALLERVAPGCQWVTSVCTGALVLAAAGLLDGRQVTTHWSRLDELRGYPVVVRDDARWVVDGNVVTAAGVSAGIDMALWLVGQLWTPTFAREVQRYLEYEPRPPYAD